MGAPSPLENVAPTVTFTDRAVAVTVTVAVFGLAAPDQVLATGVTVYDHVPAGTPVSLQVVVGTAVAHVPPGVDDVPSLAQRVIT